MLDVTAADLQIYFKFKDEIISLKAKLIFSSCYKMFLDQHIEFAMYV